MAASVGVNAGRPEDESAIPPIQQWALAVCANRNPVVALVRCGCIGHQWRRTLFLILAAFAFEQFEFAWIAAPFVAFAFVVALTADPLLAYVLAQLGEWAGLLGSAGGPHSRSTSLGLIVLCWPSTSAACGRIKAH